MQFDIKRYVELLNSFIDTASDFFERDLRQLTMSAKMALAQHHGLPTPFLDWTESPYIAVFFALWPRIGHLNAGPFTVWALQVNQQKFEEDIQLDEFNPSEPFRVMRPKIFESRRLARQFGWFTSLLVDESLDQFAKRTKEQIRLQRFDISGDAWVMILRELQLMGIGAGTLFDSLDGIADDAKLKDIIANL
jgi:FRG domain